jgi:guanine deaminase
MAALSGIGLTGLFVTSRARSADHPLVQPGEPTDAAFIARAFSMKNRAIELGDQGYGAVVVSGGQIIGESWSRVYLDQDPTAHAEMCALRDAAKRSGSAALRGAVLYSSSHPCSMCQAAANWVGIATMIHGRSATDAGPPRSCG